MTKHRRFITGLLLACICFPQTLLAQENKKQEHDSSQLNLDKIFKKNTSQNKKSSRSRMIDFEDSLVEGVNKQPWDSLNQISDRGSGRADFHIYKKRGGFGPDIQEQLQEARAVQ